MLFILALPLSSCVAQIWRYVDTYAPSNILIRKVRSTPPRWSTVLALVALATALLVAMHVLALAVERGEPGWLNVIMFVLAWDAIKFLALSLIVTARRVTAVFKREGMRWHDGWANIASRCQRFRTIRPARTRIVDQRTRKDRRQCKLRHALPALAVAVTASGCGSDNTGIRTRSPRRTQLLPPRHRPHRGDHTEGGQALAQRPATVAGEHRAAVRHDRRRSDAASIVFSSPVLVGATVSPRRLTARSVGGGDSRCGEHLLSEPINGSSYLRWGRV